MVFNGRRVTCLSEDGNRKGKISHLREDKEHRAEKRIRNLHRRGWKSTTSGISGIRIFGLT